MSFDKTILPGGEGKIKIMINSKGYGDKIFKKKIKVHTNDVNNKVTIFNITGNVEKIANIKPDIIRLSGSIKDDINIIATVIPVQKYDFSVIGKQVKKGENILVDLKKFPNKVKGWDVKVTNTRKTPGRYFDVIILKTDSTIQPRIKISVFGNISE
ncbi:MAG: hypothetical protein B6I26_04390 [Desulfobacteraceae bacterium 4572_130]|nr:MAG: hypothetical protein B6I26_04390 [Desulfobacteraceae bacterium 4572_130]